MVLVDELTVEDASLRPQLGTFAHHCDALEYVLIFKTYHFSAFTFYSD